MESLRTCKLFGVIRAVLGIEGALPLIHGPVGCFYHIRYLLSLRSGRPVRILSTEMNQNDVVFGAEDKLREKIIEADRNYSPQLIAVLSSCASSIIGENINMVIDEVKDEINAQLICINSGGFEGSQIEGYQECLTVLIKSMETEDKAPETKRNSINLIGQYRGGTDLKILKKYFNELDIDLNSILTAGCTLKEIKKAPRADINISMCEASAIEPCELMEKKFKIPFLHETLPIGVKATANYLKTICKKFNLEYVFIEDEKKSDIDIEKYLPYLKDKKAVIVAGATRATALAQFIAELGMEPVLICLDFEGKYTELKLNNLIKTQNINPVILRQPDYSEILVIAKNLKPDIIFGGMGEIGLSSELKIPLIDVMHAKEVTFGFEGAVKLVEKINEVLNDRVSCNIDKSDTK